MNGKEYMVEFDFLGKDSIRYYNLVPVDKQVFKNLKLFVREKRPSDDLFDRLTVSRKNVAISLFPQDRLKGGDLVGALSMKLYLAPLPLAPLPPPPPMHRLLC